MCDRQYRLITGMEIYPLRPSFLEVIPEPLLAGVLAGVCFLFVAIILSLVTACYMSHRRQRRRRKRRQGKTSDLKIQFSYLKNCFIVVKTVRVQEDQLLIFLVLLMLINSTVLSIDFLILLSPFLRSSICFSEDLFSRVSFFISVDVYSLNSPLCTIYRLFSLSLYNLNCIAECLSPPSGSESNCKKHNRRAHGGLCSVVLLFAVACFRDSGLKILVYCK